MAISVGGSRRGAISDINVTPMADVMIVLLIIFMVTTPLIANAPVKLPLAASAKEKAGERLELLVRGDGSLASSDGAPLALPVLRELLEERRGGARASVLVQADRDASYADVARVLAVCRAAGVDQVALAAQRSLPR
jgi:biopolymer transport protein TolR